MALLVEEGGEVNDLWPHQQRGIDETLAALQRGERRILVTSPTGGGKTRMMEEIIRHYMDSGKKIVLYTNRKLLVDQTSRVLAAAGHEHGVRSAGYGDDRHLDLQVSSIQTEGARVLKRGIWQLHDADLALIDEAHTQQGGTARKILDAHIQEGASYVGFTATPIGLREMYDTLIVAGTVSECRECRALVSCRHFGPDEPDLRKFKLREGEDLTENQNRKAMMTATIWARVWEWWKRLNPDGLPTILFAPGVGESIWFAEQFQARGVSAAHIDGQEVWVNGKVERTSREARRDVLAASKAGHIRVLCNRFVLREGVDAPWIGHGIFATVFGSLGSYLQAGGRLLRAYSGLETVCLQDHGGNWHRHGSLNADREWQLDFTASMISGLRSERLRSKRCRRCGCELRPHNPWCPKCSQHNEVEPLRCPECSRICQGSRCECGYQFGIHRKSRPVVQIDGSLVEMPGDIYKPRRVYQRPDAEQIWTRMYHRARKSGMTFRQAEALFAVENGWSYPPRTLPLMPTAEMDWYRQVSAVGQEDLRR